MFTNLLASVRELRFPLVIGYSALFTAWLLFGEALAAAARKDPVGRRLLAALDSLGSPAELGIVTFVAAIVGSVIWHAAVARLVRFIAAKGGHPDWQELIDEARVAARQYGEYRVVTTKGQIGGRPSAFDEQHTVPSATWGAHLVERVQERERKAAEMSFRVTLAIGLVPVAAALGIEGGGLWWLSLVAVPIIWLDVAMLKHTTLRAVYRYKLEDLEERLRASEERLTNLKASAISVGTDPIQTARVQEQIREAEETAIGLRATIQRINAHANRRATKIFALVEGDGVD